MKQLVEFQTKDGGTVVVEVQRDSDVPREGVSRASRAGEVIIKAQHTFEEAMGKLKLITSSVFEAVHELNNPDELAVEFGVKLTGETGVILASASAEAHLVIKLSWKRKADEPRRA